MVVGAGGTGGYAEFAGYLAGRPTLSGRQLATLFAVYGAGFAAMSATVALLFRDALEHAGGRRADVAGEIGIWLICAATGIASTLLSLIPATRYAGPWAYATLPATIELFAARWRWASPLPSSPRP